jgi:hypothetical protein
MLAGFLIGCFVGCLLGVLVTCLMTAGKRNSAYIIGPERSGVAKRGNAQIEGLGGEQGLVFSESEKATGRILTSRLRHVLDE